MAEVLPDDLGRPGAVVVIVLVFIRIAKGELDVGIDGRDPTCAHDRSDRGFALVHRQGVLGKGKDGNVAGVKGKGRVGGEDLDLAHPIAHDGVCLM